MTAKEKVQELIEVFSNDNTRDSERKAYKHAIFHVEEMMCLINYNVNEQLLYDFYMDVLNILKDERN